jgi:hypothetical protein
MIQEIDKRIRGPCKLITKEPNRTVFIGAIKELSQLLDERGKILDETI